MVVKDEAPLKAIYFINRGFANTLLHLGSTEIAYGRQEKVTGVLGPLEHFGLESFVKRGKVKVSLIAVRATATSPPPTHLLIPQPLPFPQPHAPDPRSPLHRCER